ncbi:hypothetical protein OSTOST_19190 [Ostertagia ostertagi]
MNSGTKFICRSLLGFHVLPLRLDTFVTYFNDMVVSEEDMVQGVAMEIENGMNKINSLRSQLGMEPWENKRAPPGSIELRNSIDHEIKRLKPVYEKRMEEQTVLIERVAHLSVRLGIEDDDEFSIPTDIDELLPVEKMKDLDARRQELEAILHKRLKKVQKWQKEMIKFIGKLGRETLTEDEDMLALMDANFNSEDACVSDATVSAMEEHYEQLREMYTGYVQEREFRWLELYTRLSELWDSCHTSDIERLIPPTYNPDKHTDKDFDKMSSEISRLEKLYAARKDVFDALTLWKEKWSEKLALEEKKKHPEYFQNRGRENNVFQDAKIERVLNDYTNSQLISRLSMFMRLIASLIRMMILESMGFTPPDYVKYILDEYNASKTLSQNRARHAHGFNEVRVNNHSCMVA